MNVKPWYMDFDEAGQPIGYRLDKFALHRMELVLRGDRDKDAVLPVELFWQAWRPQYIKLFANWPAESDLVENPPDLPPDDESEFLERLAVLERAFRICYEPDSETAIDFEAASRYVHVGAASALRHWRREGFSDYVTQAMSEVLRILHLLEIRPDRRQFGDSTRKHLIEEGMSEQLLDYASALGFVRIGDASGDYLSLWGVRCLVLGAFSKRRYAETQYDDAFALAVDAFRLSLELIEAASVDEEYLLAKGIVEDDFLRTDASIRHAIRRCSPLLNFTLQEVVNTFEGLRREEKSDKWADVAIRCRELVVIVYDDFREELAQSQILGQHGEEEEWNMYWHGAGVWAATQLTPNEYFRLRRYEEWNASEKRLQLYFFGDSWRNLPDKARERLRNVDTLWFSESRGLDYGSILNDLQVATENICYQYIWEPLRKAQGGQALLEFKNRDADLGRERKSPTLADYRWVCGRSFFKEFVQGAGVSEEDRRFLIQRLPRALRDLYGSRHPSQHEPEVRMPRQQVEPFVRRFLGINQEGVLRRLAEIGPKLARR